MMHSIADRAWRTLCAGRPPREIAARIAAALAATALLWACAFAFMLLEPLGHA